MPGARRAGALKDKCLRKWIALMKISKSLRWPYLYRVEIFFCLIAAGSVWLAIATYHYCQTSTDFIANKGEAGPGAVSAANAVAAADASSAPKVELEWVFYDLIGGQPTNVLYIAAVDNRTFAFGEQDGKIENFNGASPEFVDIFQRWTDLFRRAMKRPAFAPKLPLRLLAGEYRFAAINHDTVTLARQSPDGVFADGAVMSIERFGLRPTYAFANFRLTEIERDGRKKLYLVSVREGAGGIQRIGLPLF